MKNLIKVIRYLSPTCIVVVFLVYSAVNTASNQQEQRGRREGDIQLPNIISKVRSLEIVGTEVNGQVIEIKISNTTDKPVIAIGIEAGNKKDAAGIIVNGFEEGDVPPIIVLEPHGSITVDFPIGHLKHFKEGTPIKISGVMFADGTDEGDKDTLNTIRGQKAHYKAKKLQ